MPTFLASLGIKDAVYGLIIAAILGILVMVYVHGEHHIEQKDQVAAAKQEVHVAKVETTANDQITQEIEHEAQTANLPLAPVAPIRVCLSSPERVPDAAGKDSGAAPSPVVGSPNPPVAETVPTDALVQIGRDDDIYIAALEAEIATLRQEMQK